MKLVTDKDLIAQLENTPGELVTDPELLSQLNSDQEQSQNTESPLSSAMSKLTESMPIVAGLMNPGYGMAVDYLTRQAPENSKMIGGAIAEKGGEIGVNPYVSATAGMAAEILSNPLTYTPAPKIDFSLKQVSKPGITARIGEMRSGVPAMDIERLRRDPGAFFSMASREKAGEAIGKAKSEAGINLGVQHNDISTFTPENINIARSPNLSGKKATLTISEKLQESIKNNPTGDTESIIKSSGISPNEVSKALDTSNNKLSKLTPGTPAFKAESSIKSTLQQMLEIVSPGVKEANKRFSRVALRDKFMEPLPVNKSGTYSKIAPWIEAPGAALAGGMLGGPIGSGIGAATMVAARSPFVLGLQTATRGLLDKAVDPFLSKTSGQLPKAAQPMMSSQKRKEVIRELLRKIVRGKIADSASF